MSKGCPTPNNKLFKSGRHKCLIWNVLRKGTPLKDSQKRRLIKEYAKDKDVLLEISKKRGSFKNKRKLLKQSGGFLGTLLGIYKIDMF